MLADYGATEMVTLPWSNLLLPTSVPFPTKTIRNISVASLSQPCFLVVAKPAPAIFFF